MHAMPSRSDDRPAAAPARSAPQRAMARLGLVRDIDLALHLPLRYEDETCITPIARCADGQTVQVEGLVVDSRTEQGLRRQLVVRLSDDDGAGPGLVLRFLNFYPSLQRSLATGARLRARGEVRQGFFGREMVHPQVRRVDEHSPLPTALTPVYPTSAQLPQAYLRKAVESALARAPLDELLPPGAVPEGLPPLREAVLRLHHPPPGAGLDALEDRSHPAWQRLKFDELLAQQLSQRLAQQERARLRAPLLKALPGGLNQRLLAALPFALTAAQRRVCDEIAADLGRPRADADATMAALPGDPPAPAGPPACASPMNRLLQGDVGSGKTVVAALAAAVAIDSGWQCVLMAPTEILAEQHFRKLVQWLEPLGVGIAWLTGSRKGKARDEMVRRVATGEAALVVGTHAVLQHDVHFARLGLAVIDEQHRFGVAQRLELRRKLAAGGESDGGTFEPHLLMMSATPIPRTLAMTYFADLDISTLDELPPGRTPVLTKVFGDGRRDQVTARVADELDRGRQVYWVCPLIDEAGDGEAAVPQRPGGAPAKPHGAGHGPPQDLENVTATHQRLAQALPGRNVGLLHGRLPASEKAAVMAQFVSGALQVLVATTVIEVGVDVPNASLMVIEHAERFGLSQLHQLRGRVGRGTAASVCVLLYQGPLSATGKQRLRAMAETTDGFEIARRDLEIRGPGEFMGARQSGDALLRFADLAEDSALLARARRLAPRLLATHPEAARAQVARWLDSRAEFLKA